MRVMFVASPMLSFAYPMVPLAWALRLAGHEVLLATGGSALAVADAGLQVLDTAPGFTFTADGNPVVRHNTDMAERLFDGVRSWQPDLVVHDPLAPVAALAAAEHGIPVVRHNFTLPDLTPMFLELPALVAGRLGVRAPEHPVQAGPLIGFAPPSIASGAPDGWLVRCVPYNGGQLVPDWLRTPPARPVVLVTRGAVAMPGEPSPVGSVADIAAEFDVDFLLLPGSSDEENPEGLPRNVRAIGWTALSSLLPHCDAVIHHGGAGTTMGALHWGLPQLVVPNLVDRVINAELVERRGVGIKADSAAVDVSLVGRLLEDRSLREAAGEVRAEMAAMPSPGDLVEPLAALADEGSTRRSGAGGLSSRGRG